MKRLLAVLLCLLPVSAFASQSFAPQPTTGTLSGASLVANENANEAALLSNSEGTTPPAYAVEGTLWADHSNSTLQIFDGSAFRTIGSYASSVFTVPVTSGGTGLNAVSANQLFLGTAANTFTATTIPDCQTAGGTQALNFTQSTHIFSCNTVSGGGGGGVPGGSSGNIQTNSGSGGFAAYAGLSCASHKWLSTFDVNGTNTSDCTQPGTGDVSGLMSGSQFAAGNMPALTGDVTSTAGAVATTVSKIQGNAVGGTTGTVNVAFSASPTFSGTLAGAAATFSGNVGASSVSVTGSSPPSNPGLYSPSSNVAAIAANGTEGLAVSNPPSAVNFLAGSGAATGNAPSLSAQGTDTDIELVLNSKGSDPVATNGNVKWGFNLDISKVQKLIPCIGGVRAGTSDCTLLFIGDSLMLGDYSNNATSGNWRAGSPPTLLAAMLTSIGIPAESDGFMGCGNGADYQYNTAISKGSDWSCSSSFFSLGGQLFTATSGGTNPLAYTTTKAEDTCIIKYVQDPNTGKFTYSVDSGSPTTVNTAGSDTLASVTVALGSVGVHTLKINWNANGGGGQGPYIAGPVCKNSTVPSVHIVNAAWTGSASADWGSTCGGSFLPWQTCNAVANFGASTVVSDLGGNDMLNGVATSTFSTNYQNLITKILTASNFVMITQPHVNTSYKSDAVQRSYIDIDYSLAATNAVPLFDNFGRFGPAWLNQSLLSCNYTDGVHLLAQCYAGLIQPVFSFLSAQ